MAEANHGDRKKSIIQISIGLLIALILAMFSFLSKTTDSFQFYELIELKLLDQRFVIRGPIELDQNVGTIDIDALTLGIEGRYQDWTRDKYADVIDALAQLNARMIGFDVFWVEESSSDILRKDDLEQSGAQTIEEIYGLFRDYDEELRQAMLNAGNVMVGQSFEFSERQDPDWIWKNTKRRDDIDGGIVPALKQYSKDMPDWSTSGIPFYINIEHPLEKLIEASNGSGFAMTVADIDGSVRHYPVILLYNGRLWPSLALMMFLDYIGAEFDDIEIVPGEKIILPPGKLPDGTDIQVDIPINDKGLMMVNWAGDYWEDNFFHMPHASLVINQELWKNAKAVSQIKKIFNANAELVDNVSELLMDPTPIFELLDAAGIDISDQNVGSTMWLLQCREIEKLYIANGTTPEELPEHWEGFIDFETYYDAYVELNTNNKIAKVFAKYPDLSMDVMSDSIQVFPADKISLGYYILKDKFESGGLQQDDYPLYFTDPELNGEILRAEDFEGKVFIYGLTAAGTHDLNPMPYNQRYPMVGLYANIFSMFTQQNFLERMNIWTNIGLLLLLGLIMGTVVPKIKPLTGALVAVGLLSGLLLSAQYLFEWAGLWIDVLGPVTVILLSYTSITVYNFFSEEKEKKMIRGIFSRYVTKSVVDELIKNPDMVKLGGEKKVLTVFFSDVAGFTSVSEKLEPEELVALLNEYLTVMSNIILKYDGMIDKYEGDAIMAVFGTPVLYKDHALRACYVSIEMQEELAKLRQRWHEEGRPELEARIGLNTGPMIAGNMGAADRLDYTVMGDAVNLGSRLEGANKQYGTFMMVSESTKVVSENEIEYRFLDSLQVKGKNEPVKVYEIMGRKDKGLTSEVEKMRNLYLEGVDCYLAQDWEAGIGCFKNALEIIPDDGPSKVYLDRCQAYKENPPSADWDGVFVMTTK